MDSYANIPSCSSPSCVLFAINFSQPVSSPALLSLLGSNDRPAEADERLFIKNRQLFGDQISQLDGIISRLQSFAELRMAVSGSLAQLDTVLSPIRRLPKELLGHIFEYDVYDAERAPGYHSLDTKVGAFRLSHVCRHWRSITLAMPSLWTNITLDYSKWKNPPRALSPSALLLVEVRDRADLHSLSVTIRGDTREPPLVPDESDYRDPLRTILPLPYSSPWKSLCWEGTRITADLRASHEFTEYFSSLSHVTLKYRPGANRDLGNLPLTFPSVSNLRLVGLVDQATVGFDRSKITTYSAVFRLSEPALKLLASMTGLEVCTLQLQAVRRALIAEPSKDPTSLHNLRLLDLQEPTPVGSVANALVTLRHLYAPNLEELRAFVVANRSQDCLDAYIEFIQRSRCDLKRLTLRFGTSGHNEHHDYDNLGQLLSCTPHLLSLQLISKPRASFLCPVGAIDWDAVLLQPAGIRISSLLELTVDGSMLDIELLAVLRKRFDLAHEGSVARLASLGVIGRQVSASRLNAIRALVGSEVRTENLIPEDEEQT